MPWWHLSGRRARQLLLVLGISAFALAAPLGLLISKSGPLRDAIAQLGPTFSLAAAVILATGLLIHRRITAPRLAAMRTTGTTLAVAGAMMMGAAVVFAWPRPDLLIAVGLTNAAILILLALRGGLPILHTAAVGCLALALLVGFHAVQGHLPAESDALGRQLLETLLLGRSSLVLTVLALASCGASMAWIRWERRQDALGYLLGAAGLAAASLVVAVYAGFGPGGDRDMTTPVFAFYAAATMLAAAFLPLPLGRNELPTRQTLTWLGSGLLLVTLVHGLWLNATVTAMADRVIVAAATPAVGGLGVARRRLCRAGSAVRRPADCGVPAISGGPAGGSRSSIRWRGRRWRRARWPCRPHCGFAIRLLPCTLSTCSPPRSRGWRPPCCIAATRRRPRFTPWQRWESDSSWRRIAGASPGARIGGPIRATCRLR